MCFAVVEIETNRVRYIGAELSAAAKKLVRGTCYGTGRATNAALASALRSARKFRNTPRPLN